MDRDWILWKEDQDRQEAEIMKDVEGWIPGDTCYKSGRFHPPKYDIEGRPVKRPVIEMVDCGEPL